MLICDTFKQKNKEKKMSFWLTKIITLLTCKSLVLCSFLQSSTVNNRNTTRSDGANFVIMNWLGIMA